MSVTEMWIRSTLHQSWVSRGSDWQLMLKYSLTWQSACCSL